MAKVAKNLVLHGASGKLGGQLVVRQSGGKTILAQAPGARSGEPSPAQKAQQQRFQEAVLYGKNRKSDPDYQARAGEGLSAYNIAVADFLNAPDIDEIDVTDYQGAAGDTIRVRVSDDFAVQQVAVTIMNADGTLVEEGNAEQQENVLDWLYTATAANASLEGDKIIIRASDRPGNVEEGEQEL